MTRRTRSLTSFAVAIAAIFGTATGLVAQQEIIRLRSNWDYLFTAVDDGNGNLLGVDPVAQDPGFVDWAQPGFALTDPGGGLRWERGPAPFEYGGVDNLFEATTLPVPADDSIQPGGRAITHFFRHEFTTTKEFENLSFEYVVDDAAIVFLDGREVFRSGNIFLDAAKTDPPGGIPPTEQPPYRAFAQDTNGPTGFEGDVISITPALLAGTTLAAGEHVIAAAVYQTAVNSSDMGFDLRMFQNLGNEWTGDPANSLGSFSGDWTNSGNWGSGFVPDGAGFDVVLGSIPTRPTTIYTNVGDESGERPITMGALEIDNTFSYALGGHGVFAFDSGDGSTSQLTVRRGSHAVKAIVALRNDLAVDVAEGASLEFNNDVNGNGNTIITAGDVRFNNVINDAMISAAAGAVSGHAMIRGDVHNEGALLSPGDGLGVLAVGGDFYQGPEGTLSIEIGGTASGSRYDVLDVKGRMHLGGTLDVVLVDSFEPAYGDEFYLLRFGEVEATFGHVTLPELGGGLSWDRSRLYLAGSIAVVPEPASVMLLVTLGIFMLCVSRHARKRESDDGRGGLHYCGRAARRPASLRPAARLSESEIRIGRQNLAVSIVIVLFMSSCLHAAEPTPDEEIIGFGSEWRYLHLSVDDPNDDFNDADLDPANALNVAGFDASWFLPDYDEADLQYADGQGGTLMFPWQGPAPTPIGYGVINGFAPGGFATELLPIPDVGERFTVYLRQRFIAPEVSGPLFIELLADDGATIYLDGQEVELGTGTGGRINCCQNDFIQIPPFLRPAFRHRSLAVGNEDIFQTIALENVGLSPGEHTLAVSLHNQATTSSDIGFEFRLFSPGNARPWGADRSGDWADPANWALDVPSGSSEFAVFGSAIGEQRTVWTDAAVTLDGVQFDNANSYNVTGTGTVNLQGNNRNASLNATQGHHQFQVLVNLFRDTDANIATDASITFNDPLNLNATTLTKSGGGDLVIRHKANPGTGTIEIREGSLAGSGRVGADVVAVGGAIAPGRATSGRATTLTVAGNATVNENASLSIRLFGDGDNDALSGGGGGTASFELGSRIDIALDSRYRPELGDAFQILADWAGIEDRGARLNLPSGFDWNFSRLFTEGILLVTSPCDFDASGSCNGADIDLIILDMSTGTNNLLFDLTGDNVVDTSDRDEWLAQAAAVNGFAESYLLGDANLDGKVTAADLNDLGRHWQESTAAWTKGDFTGDGRISAPDLNLLGTNWQTTIAPGVPADAVPEPSNIVLFSMAVLSLMAVKQSNDNEQTT